MKNKAVKVVWSVICALVISCAFIAGCALSSGDWFKKTIKKYYYYPVAEEIFESGDLKQIARENLDAYSAYYTAEEYAETLKSNSGAKSGIGISYAYVGGKGIYVSSVVGNSPAYMCGLRAGEYLESGSADGNEITFESSADFAELVNSVGDGVNLSFTSADGQSYTVAKRQYTASYTSMSTNKSAWIFSDSADGGLSLAPSYSEIKHCLPDGTAYIRLSQFYGSAAKEFDLLVKKFNAESCTSLILDLRSNGGGYVDVMQHIAYSFSESTKSLAMLSRDKNGKEEKFKCKRVNLGASAVPKGTKIYVMANSGTASASEALIGAMVSYGVLPYENIFLSDYSEEYLNWLAEGGEQAKTARSYGKGIMQSTFVNRRTGEALKLTTAKIFWPDKTTCIHDRGLTVGDGCTPVYAEWEHTKADEELQRTVGIIQSR